ncbi:beta-mannosidase [Phycicoccus badiiscoriae]|uniref:beta-mannosidase n=1 Tax=Pedococcus badiiscoriae TaxID=642776 RepID=A0A852WDN5_9MICO|nr:glycosyl hydrolase [Pedococcus badiiscoriae]NYG07387.1 beta-mannosidase [Pedococcus badiiscoriae]
MADPKDDVLAGARWEMASAPPGAPLPESGWWRIEGPMTAAAALVASGDPTALVRDYDADDWWFRCAFTAEAQSGLHSDEESAYRLRLDGLATIADVWLGDDHLLHSENMFVHHDLSVEVRPGPNELRIRCAALNPLLTQRRTRPRWKCAELVHQNLRWYRTSLVGRTTNGIPAPAPVGPWRAVTLHPVAPVEVTVLDVRAAPMEDRSGLGRVAVRCVVTGVGDDSDVVVGVTLVGGTAGSVHCDGFEDHASTLERQQTADGGLEIRAEVEVPGVQLWWPHTHGSQPLYDVTLTVDGRSHHLRRVGFRTVGIDRTDGAFQLVVNGIPIFCRGSCWTPLESARLTAGPEGIRDRLELARSGNQNMLRVTGTGVYESHEFHDLCDELGLMVWLDCMFSFYDVPAEAEYLTGLKTEFDQVFANLQGRPSTMVVCGGSENEQEAAYLGLPPDSWTSAAADEVAPARLAAWLPEVPYVRNTPGESPLPSMVDAGPSHYFGVGAYLRPLHDAVLSRVRFASECLAFSTPPEPIDTPHERALLQGMGHEPDWKASVNRDTRTSWDLEDVRDWYTASLFGVEPRTLRRIDGEYAASAARATVATIFDSVLAQWRGPRSPCCGALVLQSHDTVFGGGLGLIDTLGRPKAPWYVMRRRMAPDVVILQDDGVNGLAVFIASDRHESWLAHVRLKLFLADGTLSETADVTCKVVNGRGSLETATIFGGFRDLSYAHKFGPPAYDVITATLAGEDGQELAHDTYVPSNPTGLRGRVTDLGLSGRFVGGGDRPWSVEVSTQQFAQWVSIEVEGWIPQDSWFHLAPGQLATVGLMGQRGWRGASAAGNDPHAGYLRSANLVGTQRIERRVEP